MRAKRDRRLAWCCVASLFASGLAGCDAPFWAVEAQPGDLRGQWLVNDSASAVLGEECPLVAHVRIRNDFSRRVRMVHRLRPAIEGKPDLKWKAYRKLPGTLEAGETWEGVWLLTGELEAGKYVVTAPANGEIEASAAEVEIRDERIPAPARAQHHCVAAQLTGEVDQVVAMLTAEIEEGKAPPSTYLQLAGLMEALGDGEAARKQYEAFAERVYGTDEMPGWLRSKLSGPDHE